MSDAGDGRRANGAAWVGFALGFAALLSNAVFFVSAPDAVQTAISWVSLVLGAGAVIFLVMGLVRAFGQPLVYRGKALTVILTVIALLPTGISILGFFHSRAVPASAGAPRVGQRVPDFALADSSGKITSLAELLGPRATGVTGAATSDPGGAAPKAVLLVFYRGYW
jgi:hypothetical protein